MKHVLKSQQVIQVEEDRDELDLEGDESSKEDGNDDFVTREISGYQPEVDEIKRSHKKGASGQSKKVLKLSKEERVKQNLLKTPNVFKAVKDELLKEAEADPENPLFNL